MPEHVHQLCCFDVAPVDKRKLGDPKLPRQHCLQGVKVMRAVVVSASEPAVREWLK